MTGEPPSHPHPVTAAYIAERLGLTLNAASLEAAERNGAAAPPLRQETADAIAALLTSPTREMRKAS